MQISYDVKLPERRIRKKHSEEGLAIEAFLKGSSKNMCFSYDKEATAKKRLGTLRGIKTKNTLGDYFDYFRDGCRIYIIWLSPKEAAERKKLREQKHG